ncbi:hypothetical protein CGZ77_10325 [Neisseria sp. KEM232]|uniref:major capsid protein n=1 Tax=unclassified Neisseria TaxID=2623750 RepID=UPI00034806FD|nr:MULTISPECIES: major capsid protein [unclassified Neisseria]ASP18094.1 hypothetical protein CGZ77_10325 [Neisseria sp. KEM232]
MLKTLKTKYRHGLAVATMTVMPALAMAEENSLLSQVKTELGGLKSGVLEIGAIVVGIAVAFAIVRIGKRGSNQA